MYVEPSRYLKAAIDNTGDLHCSIVVGYDDSRLNPGRHEWSVSVATEMYTLQKKATDKEPRSGQIVFVLDSTGKSVIRRYPCPENKLAWDREMEAEALKLVALFKEIGVR